MIHILHLEDEPVDSELAAELLREDGLEVELERVHTPAGFEVGLGRKELKLILSDFTIPGMNAREALRAARQRRPEVPFMFLSGTIGEEMAIETLKEGATDYVLKEHSSRLAPAVRRALREAEQEARRRESEAALALGKARLDGIISSAMDAVISINQEQRIVLFNPAAEKMFGVAAGEALGESINRFIPERLRGAHTRHVEEFGHTGASSRKMGHLGTLMALRANGAAFPIEASISQIEVQGEKLFTVILRDITERKRAEEAVRESEVRFRALVEAAAQVVWTCDAEGRACEDSPSWRAFTGQSLQEYLNWGAWDAVHPEDRERAGAHWQQCLATKVPYNIEYRLRHLSGEYRWTQARAVPLLNPDGTLKGWVGMHTDITERKQAEERVERLVKVRTAQLAEANANLQAFSYTAAHDLRSPLRSIKSFSSIVVEEHGKELGADGRGLLERVVGSATQMERLLNDLLEYSKMSQAELKLEPVDLGAAVREALALAEGDVRGKNAAVTVTEPLPEVIGHHATVVLLVNNFVSNALKFIAAGVKPEIRIWTEQAEERIDGLMDTWISGKEPHRREAAEQPSNNPSIQQSSRFVRLWVEDNGVGIAEKDFGKIFGAFERLHGKQAYPGTGLGLAIVRKGAERMGGRVGVESEEGKGSRFWVELHKAG